MAGVSSVWTSGTPPGQDSVEFYVGDPGTNIKRGKEVGGEQGWRRVGFVGLTRKSNFVFVQSGDEFSATEE